MYHDDEDDWYTEYPGPEHNVQVLREDYCSAQDWLEELLLHAAGTEGYDLALEELTSALNVKLPKGYFERVS